MLSQTEASRLLEAALQQMDGIIQGAKYEYNEGGANANGGGAHANNGGGASNGRASNGNGVEDEVMSVQKALDMLKFSILDVLDCSRGQSSAPSPSEVTSGCDQETLDFVCRWLVRSRQTLDHVDNLRLESEKEDLQLQNNLLTEQCSQQRKRIQDLEQLLTAKKELLKKTEQALERERSARMQAMQSPGHPQKSHIPQPVHSATPASPVSPELVHLRSRCQDLERENEELKRVRNAKLKNVEFEQSEASNTKPPSSNKTSFKKMFGKVKRSNSGGHLESNGQTNLNPVSPRRPLTPEFRRGGFRATAGARINYRTLDRDRHKPFADWTVDSICTWMDHDLGLGAYSHEVQKNISNGEHLARLSLVDLESKLNIKNALHRKKLFLAIKNSDNMECKTNKLDYHWVLRWLDDVGLPQYKDSFLEARVDGNVLNLLTSDDLGLLKVTNQLHHLSLRRGIHVLRMHDFNPDCLRRRAFDGETMCPKDDIPLWTNHRVMEWLKQVDLSEYAPNLRGSGVHGGLMILEPRFNDELMASILAIPAHKTLLRRHLSLHFKDLVGREVISEKRSTEHSPNHVPLTPTTKAKMSKQISGQFTLKRKKSKSQIDYEDLLCPLNEGKKREEHDDLAPGREIS